jgi:ABC-type glycerol-3-phosphate transport system permease component
MIARLISKIVANALVIGWTLLAVIPFILILLLAFRDNTGIYDYPLGVGGSYHPENFVEAWFGPYGSSGMAVFLGNSVMALLVGMIVNLTLGSLGAYFITQLPRRFALAYLGVFVAGTVVPFILVLVPIYRAFNTLNLLNNPPALGVVYGVMSLPTTILVLNAYFTDFPKELVEAAKVDGLGPMGVFLRIVLPLSRGSITAVTLLLIIGVWGESQLAIVMLQDGASQTAAVGILGFVGLYTANYGALFAALTIMSVPIITLYLIFSRYITRGIALGGVSR